MLQQDLAPVVCVFMKQLQRNVLLHSTLEQTKAAWCWLLPQGINIVKMCLARLKLIFRIFAISFK